MAFSKKWAGRIYGTNTGNVFLKLDGPENSLTGILRHNEPEVALAVYSIAGSFDGTQFQFEGNPITQSDVAAFGKLKGAGKLKPNGSLEGEWETDIGSGGLFILFPHDRDDAGLIGEPEQLYTTRHNFGPIVIDREQIILLAEDIQRSLPKGKVVVTIAAGSEQSRYLEDFKLQYPRISSATAAKLFCRESDSIGIDRSITVEFGPQVNYAMAQGSNEAWALGELEKLKRDLRQFERLYATKRIGIGINQLMLAGAVVFLPSLPKLSDRALLMLFVLALTQAVDWIHTHYLPHATIHLDETDGHWVGRFIPSIASWIVGIAASVLATLAGAYLKGWLSLTSP